MTFLSVQMTIVSCSSELLEEQDYTYSISSDNFYNTPAEANAAVMAPLDIMRNAYDANWYATLEIDTEYVYPKGVYGTYKYEGIVNSTHEVRIGNNWTNLYKAILYCNTALEKLPSAKNMSPSEISPFLAELRFLRAYNYFSLVKHWGAIPLRTERNIEQWDLKKSSVEEVYKFIIEDLKFAKDNCPDNSRFIGTPNKNAAKALLAEIYLYTKNYVEAKNLASEVINSNSYSLVNVSKPRDFDKVFGYDLTTSPEEIFYIKTSRTDNKTWSYLSYTSHPKFLIDGKKMLNGFGYYTHYIDVRNKLIASWDQKDLRKDLNVGFYVFGADAYGEYTALLTKYWDPNSSGGGANVSIPLIRYTDVLLTFAEASARVSGVPTPESIETLNKIKRRAYGLNPNSVSEIDYKLQDYSSLQQFIDLLINEERYERMNEAKHWDFIVRLGKAKELIDLYENVEGKPTEIVQKHFLWKIPDSEFNYNHALDKTVDQNPGY